MSLIHRVEQIGSGVVALECHECHARHDVDEVAGCGDPLQCPDCGAGGMIPRKTSRLEERFPPELAARFTPLPEALMDHAAALDLGPHELLVVWALERHRRLMGDEMFPRRAVLTQLTRLSEGQLKRAMHRLADLGLVSRRQPWKDKKPSVNHYSLDALWTKLAELECSAGHERPTVTADIGPTVGHQRPTVDEEDPFWAAFDDSVGHERPTDRGSPAASSAGHQRPTEVDALEADALGERDPAGTSPAAPDLAVAGPDADLADLHRRQEEADAGLMSAFEAWRAQRGPGNILDDWKHFTAETAAAA